MIVRAWPSPLLFNVAGAGSGAEQRPETFLLAFRF